MCCGICIKQRIRNLFFSLLPVHMHFYRVERLVAYDVLYFAGVVCGNVRLNTELCQAFSQNLVTLVYLRRNVKSRVGQRDESVLVNSDVSAFL